MDNFKQSALRWFNDGECLFKATRYGGASHAFGIAAECALKHAMDNLPGGERELPYKHLPELIDDAKRWFSGRTSRGLYQLINSQSYMAEWSIGNRYWPDNSFSQEASERFRDHARRTCMAADLGI
ncbi:MAG: hypothetical protein U9Q93_07020 [Pseudomonadota bacterium]|jgi:hypothetical protein|nr:hypothetical protein [Pseudomonadota bacterium]